MEITMLVRLLIAVLMLTGPMPVRVCTCAAAARPCVPAEEPLTQSAPETKTCGCGTRARSSEEPAATDDKVQAHDDTQADAATDHTLPDRHERDCPAINPRPIVSAVVPSPAADAPTDRDLGLPLWGEPSVGGAARSVPRPESRQTVRTVPLYIALLTLRI